MTTENENDELPDTFDVGSFRGLDQSEIGKQVMDEIRRWEAKRINALVTADVNAEQALALRDQAKAMKKPDAALLSKARVLENECKRLRSSADAWGRAVQKLVEKYGDVLDSAPSPRGQE